MNSEIDAGAMLATARAERKVVAARAHAQLARLGGETALRRPVRVEDLSADELNRDTAAARRLLRAWKRKGHRLRSGTSTLSLPSGRKLIYDWSKEELVAK